MESNTLEKINVGLHILSIFVLVILCLIIAVAAQYAIYYIELGIDYYNQFMDTYNDFKDQLDYIKNNFNIGDGIKSIEEKLTDISLKIDQLSN